MDTLVMVAQFFASLSILIILHECGHFFPAKWFKTKVDKFYLFFDPWFSLFKVQKGETEYGIGWLPLGGYVKIAGMVDESFDTEQLRGEPQPWEFRSKPAWQRLIIMLGGVTVNFILGVLLFAMIFSYWGEQYLPNDKLTYGIAVDSLGQQLGLKDGDRILKVGDKDMDRFSSGLVSSEIVINNARQIVVERRGRKETLIVSEELAESLATYENQKRSIISIRTPFIIKEVDKGSPAEQAGLQANDQVIAFGNRGMKFYHEISKALSNYPGGQTRIGIVRESRDTLMKMITIGEEKRLGVQLYGPNEIFEYENQRYSFIDAIPMGYRKSLDFINTQIQAFSQMFRGKMKPSESLGSFITIGKLYGYEWDWRRFWNLTATLSILLGFINLLPIPALDGGHVMFLLWEVITGRKPSDKVLEYSTMAGFILLMILMIYAFGIDIWRLFG